MTRVLCGRCSQPLRPGEASHPDASACLPAVLDALARADRCADPDCETARPRYCLACSGKRLAGRVSQSGVERVVSGIVSAVAGMGAPDAAACAACGCAFDDHGLANMDAPPGTKLVCARCRWCPGYRRGS